MSVRRPLPDAAAFDPTEAEAEAAERARPAKAPLCLRCKLVPRLAELPIDARQRLSAASAALGVLLHRKGGDLPRRETQRAAVASLHLTRAGKGRLCARCVDASVTFAQDIISGLDHL